MDYRRRADKLLRHGAQAERKQLLRTLVGEVKLMPQDLEVSISLVLKFGNTVTYYVVESMT